MAQLILSLNPGSSSLKFALYDTEGESLALRSSGNVQSIGAAGPCESHSLAAEQVLRESIEMGPLDKTRIQAIGCRVVHGGDQLKSSTLVTDVVLQTIRSLGQLAPLHNPISADVIETCWRLLPKVPVVAAFDTAFHQTLPPVAAAYAIPFQLAEQQKLRRYGFHGLAHQHVSETLVSLLPQNADPPRIITCHLGSGASMCAIRDGKSIDTSMGLTPMEGLVMGTRSGDLDPGLLLSLIKNLDMSTEDVDALLNHKSGLLGLSGLSDDVRVLEQAAGHGDRRAEFALDYFSYRVAKYVGSYIATLEGVDAIAFSGGIGEHSSTMRSRICRRLKCFGVCLNEMLNAQTHAVPAACISSNESKVAVWVIHADEELQIARETKTLLVAGS